MYWLTGILGVVFFIAPFLFGYDSHTGALWTSLVVGVLLIIDSVFEGIAADKQRWEYIVAMALGFAAIIAPFVLGFSTITAALWTSLIVGVVAVIVAGRKLTSGELR